MRFLSAAVALLAAALLHGVAALDPTDEYRDADVHQSGYLPNHNMDPAIVNSPQFGQLWKVPFNKGEQFYAKPLTYTPLAGGPQLLFLASSQNWIRTLNAATGAIINSRQVATPFLQSDVGCTDIPGTIGIIGTPVIDPATDTAYFFAKTYIPNFRIAGNTGVPNGVFYFYGVNVNTLADVPGFPILIDGTVAQNNPKSYFNGGVQNQRPSLTQIGSVVYGAFGSHCDLFNYTGIVMGIDVHKAQVVTQFVTEAGPLVTQTGTLLKNGDGGRGGIWMSGMGLASDGNRLFFVSGNGNAHQNQGGTASGSSGCQTLGEAAVTLNTDPSTGILSQADYFQPWDYQNLDGGDQDFGSGGIVLLDSTVFKGTGVNKMAVTAGKSGKVYILNADNLGGYRLGPGQTDGVLQTIVTNEAVFGAAGSYPGEGGYVYLTPVGYPTYVYGLGFDASGRPVLSQVAQTTQVSTGRVGVGIPTITSLNGQPGSAILWMCDPDAGLRAWFAVPNNGVMQSIKLPQVGGANKFQRPAFGNGRVYVTDSSGILYCLGSPVALPLNCSSPVNFGQLALGSKATATVSCTALIPITQINNVTTGDGYFTVNSTAIPKGSLAAGATFSFGVTWDLTNTAPPVTANVSYGNTSPGIKSTPLTIVTTNGVAGYSTVFPVSLTGTEISQAPFLVLSPNTLDYGGVVILDPTNIPSITSPFVIQNSGLSNMTILGYAWTTDDLDADPILTNVSESGGIYNLGPGFTSTELPDINSTLNANTAITIQSTFSPNNGTGMYYSYLNVWTTGGMHTIILEGSASTAPIANFSIGTAEGGWLPPSNLLMDFGNVAPGSSSSLQIRICNQGGSVLTVDKSKPPNGVFHISDPSELEETLQIPVNTCAYGTVLMNANAEEYNLPDLPVNNTWTLNTNDLTFGVHVVQIQGTVVSNKVGPMNSTTGQPIYNYLGCFKEGNAVGNRLFPNELATPRANNSNNYCQNLCYTKNYAFAATEYGDECWCGNTPPPLANQDPADIECVMGCPADGLDHCGSSGWLSVFYNPSFYVAGTNPALYGPQVPQVVGNYNYLGCYTEATTGRALNGKIPTAPATGFTNELCGQACAGFTYFGMEYGNECYCGNTINAGSRNLTSLDPTVNGCNMVCKGSAMEYCGAGGKLEMYQLNGTAVTSVTTSSTSSVSTSGASSVSTSSTSSVSSSSSVSTTTSAAPIVTGGPYTVQNVSGWSYMGCYTEATTGRALSGLQNPAAAVPVSVESCAAACAGYSYFGVEYAGECYCGFTINNGSVPAAGLTPAANGCSLTCKGNSSEYCGGGNRLNMYQALPGWVSSTQPSTGPQTVTNLAGYTYLGCYNETTGRTLNALQNPIPGANVSVENCATACGAYKYFGVEYSQQCYCGNVINAGAGVVPGTTPGMSGCNMLCAANSMEYCGGRSLLNMYMVGSSSSSSTTSTASSSTSTSTSSASSSTTTSSSATSTSTSATSTTTLSSSSTSPSSAPSSTSSSSSPSSAPSSTSSSSSPSSAPSSTSSSSSPSSAPSSTVSTSTSSSTSSSTSPSSAPSSTTSTSTSTSSSTTSSSSLSTSTSATSTSSTSTTTSTSTSSTSTSTPSTTSTSTSLSSTTTSSSSTSSSSLSTSTSATSTSSTSTTTSTSTSSTSTNTSSATSTSSSSSSTTTSSSSSTQSLTTTSSSSVKTSSSTSSTSTTTQAPSSTTFVPVPGQTYAGWAYIGCVNETAPRALTGASYSNSTGMTIESCQAFCTANNYGLAGMEYAQQCFCGNALQNYAAPGFTGCNMPCTGNKYETCGGSSRLNVFSSTSYVPPSSPQVVSGSYVYKGCYKEASAGRLLSGPSYSNSTGMTVESCVSFCKASNPTQTWAGIEYAQECYCATALPTTASSVAASQCSMLCKGNNKEFCGGSGLLDIYNYNPGAASTMMAQPAMTQRSVPRDAREVRP